MLAYAEPCLSLLLLHSLMQYTVYVFPCHNRTLETKKNRTGSRNTPPNTRIGQNQNGIESKVKRCSGAQGSISCPALPCLVSRIEGFSVFYLCLLMFLFYDLLCTYIVFWDCA